MFRFDFADQVEFQNCFWLHCPELGRTDYFIAGSEGERRSWVRSASMYCVREVLTDVQRRPGDIMFFNMDSEKVGVPSKFDISVHSLLAIDHNVFPCCCSRSSTPYYFSPHFDHRSPRCAHLEQY